MQQIHRRLASSSCQSGSWHTAHFHTHKRGYDWLVWRTGKKIVGVFGTAKQAKAYMLQQESAITEKQAQP